MSSWESDLAKGEWFEENVTRPWILKNRPDWWVTDSRNHKRFGARGGPKIIKGDRELTLPDFRLDIPNEGKSSWLDAKMKTSYFLLPNDNTTKYYSIDPTAYERYKEVINVFSDMPFDILIGCCRSSKLWLLDFKNTEPVWHEFQNSHVRHGKPITPCYSTSMMTFVGMWRPYDMP